MHKIKKSMKVVQKLLQRRGLRYLGYLLTGFLIPRISYQLLHKMPRSRLRWLFRAGVVTLAVLGFAVLKMWTDKRTAVASLAAAAALGFLARYVWRKLELSRMDRYARELTAKHRASSDSFTSWREMLVEPATREAVETARRSNPDSELVIGCIDGDGRVLGVYGPIPGLPSVTKEQFAERPRFGLDIVLLKDHVLVRKDYRGDHASFLKEWVNLIRLSGKANVPALHHVNEKKYRLYKNLILGKTIREILVDAGAKILHAQTRDDTELNRLDAGSKIEAVWERGKKYIGSCFPEAFLEEFENQLDNIHAEGVAGLSLTYGNVIVDFQKGHPWLIDFEGAHAYPSRDGLAFNYRRDVDRVKFNKCYGRNLVTERSARAALSAMSSKLDHWYAPIDFGRGLATRGFWSTDSGTGRWEYFNGPILDSVVAGKRILDLGSNNGVMPMMMLRAGARSVIGLELSPLEAECARLAHRLFEWRDIRRYSLQIHECDMREVLRQDWGKFDVVTAFCSLYYLQPDEMAEVVRKAAALAPIFIVQAKTDTRSNATENKSEKSSLHFLRHLLEENGFPEVEVIAPEGFSRPLLIGRVARGRAAVPEQSRSSVGSMVPA